MNVRNMPLRILMVALFLLVSCSNSPTQPASNSEIIFPTATQGQTGLAITEVPPTVIENLPAPQETSAGNCASAEIDRIGQSIAEPYPFTTVEEVMTWFCNGAEFEDILMALETEELNGTSAEEMLEMRAEGLSWDDIWLIVGFVE